MLRKAPFYIPPNFSATIISLDGTSTMSTPIPISIPIGERIICLLQIGTVSSIEPFRFI
jgi:hypothetical protein